MHFHYYHWVDVYCHWVHSFLQHALHFVHRQVLLHTFRQPHYIGELALSPSRCQKRVHPVTTLNRYQPGDSNGNFFFHYYILECIYCQMCSVSGTPYCFWILSRFTDFSKKSLNQAAVSFHDSVKV